MQVIIHDIIHGIINDIMQVSTNDNTHGIIIVIIQDIILLS